MATVDVAYDVKVYVEPSRVVPLRDEQRLFVVADLTRQRGSKQVRWQQRTMRRRNLLDMKQYTIGLRQLCTNGSR